MLILAGISNLSSRERSLCYFNSDKKIVEASATLESADYVKIPVNSNLDEYSETEKFMDSIKHKPIHEQKQKLGNILFPKVKVIIFISGHAILEVINEKLILFSY